jgi:hypothetical protein
MANPASACPIGDHARVLAVPVNWAVDGLALTDGAGEGRARLIPSGEDGGNWAYETVGGDLPDEALGLRPRRAPWG